MTAPTRSFDEAAAYSEALTELERYVTTGDVLLAFWMMLRVSDMRRDRTMAETLADLVERLNTVREMNRDPSPIVPTRRATTPGTKRLVLASAAAIALAEERKPGCRTTAETDERSYRGRRAFSARGSALRSNERTRSGANWRTYSRPRGTRRRTATKPATGSCWIWMRNCTPRFVHVARGVRALERAQ